MNAPRKINLNESLLSLAEVPDAVPRPRPGRKVSLDAISRWITRGIAGVRLEVLYVGGTRHTSREALGRFFEAVSVAKGQKPVPAGLSPAAARAEAELDAAGI